MRCDNIHGISLALIVLMLSCVGCSRTLPEPRDTSDSMICDASIRQDCISVTEGFVYGRIDDESRIIRLQQALKACQERGP